MAFFTDFVNVMLSSPKNLLVKAWTVQITQTFWKPLWGHCCKNMSQMTYTMPIRPASSTKLWPTEHMHLVLKLLEAQIIWTPKIGWVSCCVPTWQGTDKLAPLIIGNAAEPHALKRYGIGLSDLKVDYYHNSNGWMTAVMFEHWLGKWNERLERQKHHILLLVDNAPLDITKTYSNIRV